MFVLILFVSVFSGSATAQMYVAPALNESADPFGSVLTSSGLMVFGDASLDLNPQNAAMTAAGVPDSNSNHSEISAIVLSALRQTLNSGENPELTDALRHGLERRLPLLVDLATENKSKRIDWQVLTGEQPLRGENLQQREYRLDTPGSSAPVYSETREEETKFQLNVRFYTR